MTFFSSLPFPCSPKLLPTPDKQSHFKLVPLVTTTYLPHCQETLSLPHQPSNLIQWKSSHSMGWKVKSKFNAYCHVALNKYFLLDLLCAKDTDP
jgi:hypothetical protein